MEQRSNGVEHRFAAPSLLAPLLTSVAMLSIWIRTLQLSVKSLWMHPLRSSLTVLGIFIGVSSVIWLLALGEGISRAAQEQISSLGALNIIVRTVKPSGDQAPDAGYGLTRNDYVRLVATVPTIAKAIPMRIIPSVEFHNKNRKMEGRLVGTTPDYAEVTRLVVDRGRFLSDCRCRRTSATTACWRPRWPTSCFRSASRSARRCWSTTSFYRGRRRDAAADGVGRHRRVAGGREFFERHLRSDHDAVAPRRAT